MKKIIVTGGSGFIGSNLVNFLLKRNFFVINIDKLTYSSNKLNIKNKKNYRFFKTDINNRKEIFNIIKKYKPSAIFNLAAETHVDRSIDNPKEFILSNILGVFNILEILRIFKKRKKEIKLIHISTDEVFGDILNKKERSDENYPYKPSSPYSATKASADHLIRSYVRTYNLKAIISNCSNNYGPFQFPEKLLPKMIANIIRNKPLPLYAKGLNSREWIYVEDHCDALLKIYKRGKSGESYNVGSNKNMKNIDLIKSLLNIMKQKKIKIGKKVKIKFVKDRPGHDFRYALNSKKISKKINWKSNTNIKKGLSMTVDWYLKNKKFLSTIPRVYYEKRIGLKL